MQQGYYKFSCLQTPCVNIETDNVVKDDNLGEIVVNYENVKIDKIENTGHSWSVNIRQEEEVEHLGGGWMEKLYDHMTGFYWFCVFFQ